MGEESWLAFAERGPSGALGVFAERGTKGPFCEEVSGQVFVLEQVLEEAWHTVGYFEEVQLTQLFSTENNLSIHALL